MRVDPETGEVIEVSPQQQGLNDSRLEVAPDSQRISAAVGNYALEQTGFAGGHAMAAMNHVPSVFTVGIYNKRRIANTIIGGTTRRGRLAMPGHNRTRFKYGNYTAIGGRGIEKTPPWYAPDTLARFGNFAGRKVQRYMANDKFAFGKEKMAKYIPKEGNIFNSSFFGRQAAAQRIARSGFKDLDAFNAAKANVVNFLEATDPKLASLYKGTTVVDKQLMSNVISMSNSQGLSARAAGFQGGLFNRVDPRTRMIGEIANPEWLRGSDAAVRWLGHGGFAPGERIGLKGFAEGIGRAWKGGSAATEALATTARAGKVAKFATASVARTGALVAADGPLPILDAVAIAMLAYDVVSMGMEGVKGGIEFAGEAMTSLKGSLDKPVMGMGYVDNDVNATSRARGVAAIQNSRMNARSVLGNEASYLHGHFG